MSGRATENGLAPVLLHMKTRRTTFAALIGCLALVSGGLFMPFTATAHDGAHVTRIVSDVQDMAVEGQRMTLSLAVSNFSETAVVLQSVTAPSADVTAIPPVLIRPGTQQDVKVTLFFQKAIPGIFTAILDFGEDGQGPVLVMN